MSQSFLIFKIDIVYCIGFLFRGASAVTTYGNEVWTSHFKLIPAGRQ